MFEKNERNRRRYKTIRKNERRKRQKRKIKLRK